MSKGQNLVPNNSFEDTLCTTPGSYYMSSMHWVNPIGTSPDYYNFNMGPSNCSINIGTVFGNQSPHSGSSFVGVAVFQQINNRREYIGVKLTDTLQMAHDYCVSYYISLAGRSKIAVKNVDLLFAFDSIFEPTKFDTIPLIPQINNSGIVVDSVVWTEVSGMYTAIGGEKFIYIGNFNGDSTTDTINLNYGSIIGSYYYIDDVSVVDCTVGLNEINQTINLSFYPVPANNIINISFEVPIYLQSIKIYDLTGLLIKEEHIHKEIMDKEINISALADGIYFCHLNTPKGSINKKIIVQSVR